MDISVKTFSLSLLVVKIVAYYGYVCKKFVFLSVCDEDCYVLRICLQELYLYLSIDQVVMKIAVYSGIFDDCFPSLCKQDHLIVWIFWR